MAMAINQISAMAEPFSARPGPTDVLVNRDGVVAGRGLRGPCR